ncbi:unnamed protein product [Brassica oleracea]
MVEKCRYYGQVREPGKQNQDKVSPYISELLQLEELGKQEGLGRRSKVPGAAEASKLLLSKSVMAVPSGFVAGLQAPSMGRRSTQETVVETDVASAPNGAEPRGPLTSAQRLAASAV